MVGTRVLDEASLQVDARLPRVAQLEDALGEEGDVLAQVRDEEQVELPEVELQSAAIESLAPLLAQYACLLTRGDAVERAAAR